MNRRDFLSASAAAAATAVALPVGSSLAAPSASNGPGSPPQFKLGIVTYQIAADWDLPTILKVLKNVGIGGCELRTTHKHGVEPGLGKEQRQEVRKRFDGSGVQLWGLGSVCEFQSPDAAVVRKNVETCKQFIDLAADVGSKGVKVRPNGLPKEVPVEKTLEQIGKALVTCGQAAADRGVEIWMEVHGGGTQIPANARTIMQHCNHPAVGLTWNSNDTDKTNGSVEPAFRMLRPWIRSCHINELYKDAAGIYPYRELFRLFRETGYDRYTLCEVGKGMPMPAAGEEMLRYYKALWTELARG